MSRSGFESRRKEPGEHSLRVGLLSWTSQVRISYLPTALLLIEIPGRRGQTSVAIESPTWIFNGIVSGHFFSRRFNVSLTAVFFRFVCLIVWFLNVLVNYKVISRTGPKTERLTILRAATHEIELGDHDFYLSRSHYTDTDPTSRERAATAGIEPGTSFLEGFQNNNKR